MCTQLKQTKGSVTPRLLFLPAVVNGSVAPNSRLEHMVLFMEDQKNIRKPSRRVLSFSINYLLGR